MDKSNKVKVFISEIDEDFKQAAIEVVRLMSKDDTYDAKVNFLSQSLRDRFPQHDLTYEVVHKDMQGMLC